MLNTQQIKDNFGSIRLITALTPDTFTRKIIIISTTFSIANNRGETAIKQENALNYFHVNYNEGKWDVLKKHRSLKKAIEYHFSVVNSKTFSDCEKVKKEVSS